MVRSLFAGFGAPILPILASPEIWAYRGKMEFSFSEWEGEKALGFSLKGQRGKLVQIEECHLVNPWFVEVLKSVRRFWSENSLRSYFPPKDRGHLKNLTLREGMRTGEKMVILTVSGNPLYPIEEPLLDRFVQMILDRVAVDTIALRRQIIRRGVPTEFEERILYGRGVIHEELIGEYDCPVTFTIRPASFFQPNPRFIELFFAKARKLVALAKDDFLLDLYCGAATFGLLAASLGLRILGIEQSSDAIRDAKENVAANGATGIEILQGDVSRLLDSSLRPTIVVVDPPRSGLAPRTIKKLVEQGSPKILYISCNPATQKEDVEKLVAGGYGVKVVAPGDQFPRTSHVENIVALERIF